MWEEIDWSKYKVFGQPDIAKAIHQLFSNDYASRMDGWHQISIQLEWSYINLECELASVLIPVLIELLLIDAIPDKSSLVDLLIVSASHYKKNLDDKYQKNAISLRDIVCKGLDTYKKLDQNLLDIDFLIRLCNEV